MTVLLARNRQPPPTVTAGVPHAELAAELVSLPSGLLAMVCEAILKLKVRRGVAWACVRFGCVGHRRGADEVLTRAQRQPESGTGQYSRRGLVPPWRSAGSTASRTVSTLQVSDVARPRRDSQHTGALRRSSHAAGEGQRLYVPCFHPAEEPTTAQ